MDELQKRSKIRQKSLRSAIKRPGNSDYSVINQGASNDFTPAENIGRLEFLRSMAYPELIKGLQLDKKVVKVSFRVVNQ